MSRDINIITRGKPDSSEIEAFASEHPEVSIDGPFEVQDTDVPEAVFEVVSAPHWLTQIALPMMANRSACRQAKCFASEIAEAYHGAAYDLQKDVVFWPKRKRKSRSPQANTERIRLIELEWCLPVDMGAKRAAELLLELLAEMCPQCLPTRYGTFEPFQQIYSAKSPAAFLNMWRIASEVVWGDSLFWQSAKPCAGGSVSFPDKRDAQKPSGADRYVGISLSFDGRAVHDDSRWRELVVNLFQRFAERSKAFYAAGHVLRNVIAGRHLSFDGTTEGSPFPRSRWWLGLPTEPVWLSWFGAPYREWVAKTLNEAMIQEAADGLFVRLGVEPADRDQLREIAPELPAELLVRSEDAVTSPERKRIGLLLKTAGRPAKEYMQFIRQPASAEHIPDLQ